MTDIVFVKTYPAPAWNRQEILRYAGCKGGATAETEALLDSCIKESKDLFTYKVCYREFPVVRRGDLLDLTFTQTESRDLKKNLAFCDRVIVFSATVGLGIDRLILKYGSISQAKALFFQAIGAERIEALCDAFNEEIKAREEAEGFFVKPRFSPGYGDFPLEKQRDFFSVLDCPRKIGLSLNESFLMSPTKSVTALIGVGKKPEEP